MDENRRIADARACMSAIGKVISFLLALVIGKAHLAFLPKRGVCEDIIDRHRGRRDTRRTVNALRALNPTQLEDIGLTMADVEDFGRTGL